MKALKHLKNRFEFALKTTKNLKLNQLDIEALDALIDEENERQRNTSFEDALILFYLLMAYKVTNNNNKAILARVPAENVKFPMGLPEAADTLSNLSRMIDPKQEVIRKIADEIWIYQEYERIPKDKNLYLQELQDGLATFGKDVAITQQEMIPIPEDQRISFKEVEELIEKALQSAKENFPTFKALNNDYFRNLQPMPLCEILKRL